MTGVRGWADGGAPVDPLTPETLRVLLTGAAAEVTVVRAAEEGPAATARRDGPQAWQVEVRADDTRVVGRAPNTDAAFDLLRSWAAGDDWWRQVVTWQPAGS